jgi:putative transposase
VKPRARCTLAEWAQTTYRLSQRRAARLIPVRLNTWRYELTRDPQEALRQRLRELAAVRVRFGYRRLTVLLRREGWRVNAKRIYRLYSIEGLKVRTKPRRKLASRARVPAPRPTRPNERWAMDFVSTRLVDGRWFRTLTVLDLYTRESLALVADRSLTGAKVAAVLTGVLHRRPPPQAITVDNGSEFVSRAMDAWAYAHDVRLDFIRPGKPVENAFIESFNGKLRDECLNAHVFATVAEAQVVLDVWREDDNGVRRHSALQDRTPAAVGALWVDSRVPRESTAMKNDGIELEITGASVAFPL